MEADASLFIAKARALLVGVTRSEATIAQFERAYLELYSEAPASLPPVEGSALEEVFWAVENHVDDPDIRGADELDDGQLLEVAGASLDKLTQ